MSRTKSLVGLFTDVLPTGGVQRAGRQVAAVAAKFASEWGLVPRFLSLNDPRGVHTLQVGSQEFSVSGYAGKKLRFARAALRAAGLRPALVFAMHPHLSPIVSAMRLRNPRFQSIIFTHGVEVWRPLAWPRGTALRTADVIVGPSSDTVRHLISEQQISEEKTRLLPWALDPEFERRIALGGSSALPAAFPRGRRVVLTVGRWDPEEKYKGADTLIAALPGLRASIPDVSLVLVGDGKDRPRLEQIARDLGVSDLVVFLSRVEARELAACYANCELFALPSRGEGFGLVFLEAMAYGKPVIGGAHGGVPDIVQHGVTGLLTPFGDVEKLSSSLEFLLSDSQRAREMGARGRERVHEEYTFDIFRSRLSGLLQETLRSS